MISAIVSLYGWRYPSVLVYMLQSTEYCAGPYLAWFWRTQNFSRVMHRRALDPTKSARLLLAALRVGMLAQIVAGLLLIGLWRFNGLAAGWEFGLALVLAYPIVWAHLVVVPLLFGRWLIVVPKERRLIKKSEAIFAGHTGVKIAVAGSYGKTSMKEMLLTVLGEGKKVAATPANKNVSVSHAQFAAGLAGDEDILIIEYGESAPGDVERFAETTHPTHAVITGVAPAHLDKYKTLEAAGHDIFAVARYLRGKNVYVNAESSATRDFMKSEYYGYNADGAFGWKVKNIKLAISGTNFDLTKGKRKLHLHSELLGKHQVGPLALTAALALELGLSEEQVVAGVAKTAPFEHRMQPYQLAGAWIIDDTYNGNIEGIRAGTELLAALPARRKLYVTPGLVDQGRETENVHRQMGELIARAKPDVVVLMQNSAAAHIQAGLEAAGYKGALTVEPDPLNFYTNLDQFVASGDVALLQNDWTDNYS
jgi:UDP-N-acetylmuramyl pentapeptide synthase